MLIFLLFLKKNLGGIGGNSVRAMPAHWNREIPAFAGMGRGGGFGERGEWEVLVWGVFLFGVFFGMFLFGECWRSENESAEAKTKQLPIPAKAGMGEGAGMGSMLILGVC